MKEAARIASQTHIALARGDPTTAAPRRPPVSKPLRQTKKRRSPPIRHNPDSFTSSERWDPKLMAYGRQAWGEGRRGRVLPQDFLAFGCTVVSTMILAKSAGGAIV